MITSTLTSLANSLRPQQARIVMAFKIVAVLEACSWALLLVGMYLKYGAKTTEVGVQVGGAVHGGLFIMYLILAALTAVVQRWSLLRSLTALACSIPPFCTLFFELVGLRRGYFAAAQKPLADAPSAP